MDLILRNRHQLHLGRVETKSMELVVKTTFFGDASSFFQTTGRQNSRVIRFLEFPYSRNGTESSKPALKRRNFAFGAG